MRRKSMQEVVRPAKPQESLDGITRALAHAKHMHGAGHLSDAERDDFAKLAMAEGLNHLPDNDFDSMLQNGGLDRVREAAGYEDGDDPEAVDGRRHAVGVRVLVNLLAGAAHAGHIDPQEALAIIKTYTAVPEGDDASALASLHADSCKSGKCLAPPEGEDQMSDADIDAALAPGMHHSPMLGVGRRTPVVDMPANLTNRGRG